MLFIVSKENPRCEEELARLRRPGGDFETMQTQGWKIGPGPENHLQIIDNAILADTLKHIDVKHYPVFSASAVKKSCARFAPAAPHRSTLGHSVG